LIARQSLGFSIAPDDSLSSTERERERERKRERESSERKIALQPAIYRLAIAIYRPSQFPRVTRASVEFDLIKPNFCAFAIRKPIEKLRLAC